MRFLLYGKDSPCETNGGWKLPTNIFHLPLSENWHPPFNRDPNVVDPSGASLEAHSHSCSCE